MFDAFKEVVTERRSLLGSLAVFWTILFVVFWSGAFSTSDQVLMAGLMGDAIWIVSVTCNALSLAFFTLVLARRPHLNYVRLASAACLVTTCSLALIVPKMVIGSDLAVVSFIAGTVLLGMGTGLLMACLGGLLCAVSPRTTFVSMAMAFAAASIGTLVMTTAFVSWAVWVSTALLPVALARLYARAFRGMDQGCSGVESSQKEARPNEGAKPVFPLAAFACLVAIIGLSAGIMRGVNQSTALVADQNIVFIVTVLATSVVLLCISPFIGTLKPTLLLQIVVIVVASAFIALVLFAREPAFAFVLHTAGFLTFVALVWFFCSYYAWESGVGPRGFAIGLFANQAGQAAGSLLCLVLASGFGSLDSMTLYVSFGMVNLLYIAALLFFSNSSRAKRQNQASGLSVADVARVLGGVSGPSSLTPREVEIAARIVRGDGRSEIAEAFGVSQETVKTHTKHLYQKLDVHSRKELMAFVDQLNDRDSLL